jgi:site-specific recombinase XerD
MKPKGKTGDSREIRYLDQAQVRKLFSVIPSEAIRDRLLFGFIYKFGLRASEACLLPTSALNRQRWEVTIRGLKNGLTRTYTVPRDLQGLLRKWRPQGDTLFAGRQGTLSRVRVWQLWRAYAEAAGIPADLTVHSLRHTAAVHALDAGLSTEDVRDLLRHRKLSTTDIYANLSVRRRRDYLQRLEQSLAIVRVR